MAKRLILPPSAQRRLISNLMRTDSNDAFDEKGFSLKSSTEFASRSSNIFGQLHDIEKSHENWVTQNKTEKHCDELDIHVEDKAKVDVFKKPFKPSSSRRKSHYRVKRNPNKWTMYSLTDIPVSSDATNAAVAFQFLDELRKRRANENKSVDAECENVEKIKFCKPAKCSRVSARKTSESSVTTALSSDTRICSSNSSVEEASCTTSNIKLEHLQEHGE